MNLRAVILGFTTYLMIFPAFAAEKLQFNQSLSERERRLIENFSQENIGIPPEQLKIAPADLNQDGLDEFIITTSKCNQLQKKCDFNIVAEVQEQIISLGTITARNILLGNEHSSGVRNLLVFEDTLNDFNHKLYVWAPKQSRYILSE